MNSPRTLTLCQAAACVAILAGDARGDAAADAAFRRAAESGVKVEEVLRRTRGVVRGWLKHADPRTGLLPDYLPTFNPPQKPRSYALDLYRPHNSGADNTPYLAITTFFTEPALWTGRMREMLRNEVRYTIARDGLPGELDLKTGTLGPPSIFGAAEYCKDGMLAVTELFGRTPYFYRMVDSTEAVMRNAPVETAFGKIPDAGAEVNGDLLQTLVRLYPMTGDRRFLEFAERIGDAYVLEVLPKSHGLPAYDWDFARHTGPDRIRLRDHGNEIIVGLVLLHAIEDMLGSERATTYRKPLGRMLDRVLASANADGMLSNEIRCSDLKPLDAGISDNWGYIYGAVYTYYMVTGEVRYREAVLRALRALPKYLGFDWERGRVDGYSDAIESALYLVAREPVPEAIAFVDSEVKRLMAFQKDPNGIVEGGYPDGNYNRTMLLYALWKSQGTWIDGWRDGVKLGAERDGDRLYVAVDAPASWRGRVRFDYARHKREMNLPRNYVRLNEWPEWYVVDESRLYRVTDGKGRSEIRLGLEFKDGLPVRGGARLVVEPTPAR